jgi:hypothetical protein
MVMREWKRLWKNEKQNGKVNRFYMEADPELITIVEGPPPEFKTVDDAWMYSLLESSRPYYVALCQVRSFKGQTLLERCQRAWSSQRPIRLDFPTLSGLRKQLEIVAARYEKLPEGDLLNLWVRHTPQDIADNLPDRDEGDAE